MNKKPLNIEVGQRLRTERERAGLTRENLAEAINVTPRFIADIERGSVGISIDTLKRLCIILNISADRLLFGSVSVVGIDERLRLLDSAYIDIIDKAVKCQLDLIKLAESKKVYK